MAAYREAIEWQRDKPNPSEQPYINLGKLLMVGEHSEEALALPGSFGDAPRQLFLPSESGRSSVFCYGLFGRGGGAF
jgi:hypothetical protein